MGLIESFKASAIRTADALNRLNDPFEPFDRPAFPKEHKKLSDLESEFYQDLVSNFWGCDGQVLLHRLPQPPGSPLDLGDQALWHGIYTATLAMRYYLQDAGKQADTYGPLVDAVKGLQLHQNAHGEAKPRLIRGVSDDLRTWQDDASNDSATGHLLGIYFGHKFGPKTMRPVFAQLASGLAAELHNNADCLVGANGQPTTYGALVQGWKTDPLRLTLALAVYAVAATLTHEPAFMKAYSDLWEKYRALVAYPKVKPGWLENQNDTHRAAIHLALLADLTTGVPRLDCLQGLERIRRMVAKDGNIWVNALCQWGDRDYGWTTENRDQALKVLSEFTLTEKQFNPGVDNAQIQPIFANAGDSWKMRPVLWNGTWMANQPLPRWAVRSQDFFWQRNLRSLDVGSAGAPADSRFNGGDFLAAYWLSRLTGLLGPDD